MVLQRKIFAILLLLLVTIFLLPTACKLQPNKGAFAGYAFPKPVGWVNDFEHLFSIQEADTLNRIIDSNEKATTNEIAIVVTNDAVITNSNFKDYVTALHNKWGVGKKTKDNGVVICIVPSLHLIRIGNGYGIEKKMSDEETAKIISEIIVPEFKKGYGYQGVKNGLLAVIDKIK